MGFSHALNQLLGVNPIYGHPQMGLIDQFSEIPAGWFISWKIYLQMDDLGAP
jgi:hypothetical protein